MTTSHHVENLGIIFGCFQAFSTPSLKGLRTTKPRHTGSLNCCMPLFLMVVEKEMQGRWGKPQVRGKAEALIAVTFTVRDPNAFVLHNLAVDAPGRPEKQPWIETRIVFWNQETKVIFELDFDSCWHLAKSSLSGQIATKPEVKKAKTTKSAMGRGWGVVSNAGFSVEGKVKGNAVYSKCKNPQFLEISVQGDSKFPTMNLDFGWGDHIQL